MDMQAVIMAGGEGSRLRPLTSNLPKPMLPVANRPIMEHIIELLRHHGFTDVVATVQFLSSVIRNHFGDGSDLGVSMSYATEEIPLGTAGSVLGARDFLSGTFMVISGDALTDLDLEEVVAFHRSKGAAATLVLKHMKDPLEFGIVMTSPEGAIERFLEKPTWGQVFSDTINTGIYVLEPDVLDLIPPDQPYDFSAELFPMMLDKGLPLFGFVTDSYWTDVGNTDAYLQAHYDVLARRVKAELPGFELRPGVWVGEDVDVHPSARIEAPALLGDNAQVGAGATIGPSSVLGDNCTVGDDATVAGGVLQDRAHLGAYARVSGGVIGRNSSLGKGATVEEGAVVGDEVSVGAGAIIKPRVKVYSSRTVESGAIVNHSIVRERRAGRSVFGARGVRGLINVGITPVTAVRLGMAFGSSLKRGSVVITSRDASRAARTLKRGIIAGLNATGVTCHDLELAPMTLTRFNVRSEQASGGISVRSSPGDPEAVEIRLFDSTGADISAATQRKIDRIYFREDYRSAPAAKLGELEFPARALEQYASGLLRSLDVSAIRTAKLKVVIDYAYGPAALIGPSIIGRLGCDALALNAFTDEYHAVLSQEELDELKERVSELVKSSGSDLGVLLEPGGEIAHLVDDTGRFIEGHRALMAFLRHEVSRGVDKVAVPVSSPRACESIAEKAGATLQWTPTSLPALMARAARPDVGFAGNTEGELIFPGFLAAPDAIITFCKALELVACSGRRLSDHIDELPEVHMARRDVRTPWDLKGAVMRAVAAGPHAAPPARLMLLDGVKVVNEDRWALVIPWPDEPLCRIWAEAPDEAGAQRLAEDFAALVTEVVTAAQPSSSESI